MYRLFVFLVEGVFARRLGAALKAGISVLTAALWLVVDIQLGVVFLWSVWGICLPQAAVQAL